jgi:hypothetical protein
MTDGIGAAVHSMQLPRPNAASYRPRAQPERQQLDQRNHPMLPSGDLGYRPVQPRWHRLRLILGRNLCHFPIVANST